MGLPLRKLAGIITAGLAPIASFGFSRSLTINSAKVPNTNQVDFPAPFRTPIGTVTTNGTAVTGSTGDGFPTWLAGNPIFINGVEYTVLSVTNSAALVLTGSAGVQASPVAWNGTPYLRHTSFGGKVRSLSGYDIVFTSDSLGAVRLNHEIKNYDPRTGVIAFHFKHPLVKTASDTVLYIWYGSTVAITSQENVTSVWNASLLVNHVNQWNLEPYKQAGGVYTTVADEGYYGIEPSIVAPDVSLSGNWEMFLHIGQFRSSAWHEDTWWYSSPDGVTWTRQAESIKDVFRGWVFRNPNDSNKYWMYGTDTRHRINLYKSTTQGGFVLATANCIVGAGGNETTVDNSTIFCEAGDGNPTDIWYDGFNGNAYLPGHATSVDGGITWTKNPANPCVWIGQTTTVYTFSINWVKKIGSTYYAIVHGTPNADAGGLNGSNVYLATSTDKITWTTVGGLANPLICRTQTYEGKGDSTNGQVGDVFAAEYGGYVWMFFDNRSQQGVKPFLVGTADRVGMIKVPGTINGLFNNVPRLRDSTAYADNPAPGATNESQIPIAGLFGNTRSFIATLINPPCMAIPDASQLDIPNLGSFQLSLLMASNTAGGAVMSMFAHSQNGGVPGSSRMELYLPAATNTLGWIIQGLGGALHFDGSAGGTGVKNVRDGARHYVVLQRDISANKVRTYVDGVLEVNITPTSTGALNSTFPATLGKLSRTAVENTNFYTGTVELIELKATIDSADWHLTRYNALIDPSTFFSMANEQAH